MRRFDRSLPMALLRAREVAMSFFRPLLNRHGLTEQQWRVLRVLHERGELEFHELAAVSWIQPASLSGMVTRLARAALVRRTRSPTDQRRLHLSLTPEGRRRFAAVARQSEALYREIERQLGRERLGSLMGMLGELERLQPPDETPLARTRRRARPEPRSV